MANFCAALIENELELCFTELSEEGRSNGHVFWADAIKSSYVVPVAG